MKRGWKSPKIGSMYYTEELPDEYWKGGVFEELL